MKTKMAADLKILIGDWIRHLRELADGSVQMCVTSPPYWGLRDYNVAGQVGHENSPEAYIEKLVEGFRELRRVLRADGTLWLNLGDSYAAGGRGGNPTRASSTLTGSLETQEASMIRRGMRKPPGYKAKDLIGVPWMAAFALRNDGWYLRSDIIWHKPNCMPESVTDRPSRCHENVFLLSKSKEYYYDADAIKEPAAEASVQRWAQKIDSQAGSMRGNGGQKTNGAMKAVGGPRSDKQSGHGRRHAGFNERWDEAEASGAAPLTRNKRDVWTVSPACYKAAHFATFPPELIKPCILAGSMPGGVVLDPFAGSGTTGQVALELGREAILIELNPEYESLIRRRCSTKRGLALT